MPATSRFRSWGGKLDPSSKQGQRMEKRAAELERSAQSVGRHPRSYPRQNLVWEKDKQMAWRLSRLQNAKNDLVSVLEAEGSADILQQQQRQQEEQGRSSLRDGDSESLHSRTDSTQTALSSASEALRPGSAAVKREKKAERLRNTKKRLKGAIGAIGVVKYLEQSDDISVISDQDKVDRQKALLHVRMFGVKTPGSAGLERRKRDAIMKNALNRQFKRSDFNPMPGVALFYGCMVAFEAPDGSWLSVNEKTGSMHTAPRNRGGQYVFKIVDLRNPNAAGPIKFGDECWVCAREGTLRQKYTNGQVVGTVTRKAFNIAQHMGALPNGAGRSSKRSGSPTNSTAVTHAATRAAASRPGSRGSGGLGARSKQSALSPSSATDGSQTSLSEETRVAPANFGAAGSQHLADGHQSGQYNDAKYGVARIIKAFVPSERDSVQLSKELLVQAKSGNKQAMATGRWRLRLARRPKGADGTSGQTDNCVFNLAQIFLEQDWFYLMCPVNGEASIKALPKRALGAAFDQDEDASQGLVDPLGTWTVHLVQASAGVKRIGLADMEQLLYKARTQMQDSSKRRDGGKVYEHQLVSGASFSKQIRRKNRGIELKSEVSYAREEEKVERQFGAAVADPENHSLGRTRAFLNNLERKHNPQLAAALDAKDRGARPQTSSRLSASGFNSPAATSVLGASSSQAANVKTLRLPRASSASGARLISRGQTSPVAQKISNGPTDQQAAAHRRAASTTPHVEASVMPKIRNNKRRLQGKRSKNRGRKGKNKNIWIEKPDLHDMTSTERDHFLLRALESEAKSQLKRDQAAEVAAMGSSISTSDRELDQVLAAQAKKMAALGDQSSAIAGHISRQTSGGQNPQSTTAASGVDGQASQGGAWTPKEELPYALQRIVDQDTRLRDYIELDHAIMVDAAQEAQEKQELAHRNAEKINRGLARQRLLDEQQRLLAEHQAVMNRLSNAAPSDQRPKLVLP